MAMFIVKPWYRKKDDAIYGAEWAGTSDPSWVRTDAAVGFSDPNPYYAGMSTTPSSPFDNIMPWAGMRRVTDANAGELVEIPKFYYKWTRDGVKMKLQISMSQFGGSHVSPAHADRGDGVGERDYVYVGRYHCASDYKSKTGVLPKNNYISIDTARTYIHQLGSTIWQYDIAIYTTISMLYLVEYAHWDSQAKIGYGCGNGSSVQNNGASDTIPYHTGTSKSSRATYGVGVQYRYIEDLWANVFDRIDGIYTRYLTVYAVNNPSNNTSNYNLGDNTNMQIPNTNGSVYTLKSFSSNSIIPYLIVPNEITSDSGYVTDKFISGNNSITVVNVGGCYSNQQEAGLFYLLMHDAHTDYAPNRGCRLMVLPSSRLSA